MMSYLLPAKTKVGFRDRDKIHFDYLNHSRLKAEQICKRSKPIDGTFSWRKSIFRRCRKWFMEILTNGAKNPTVNQLSRLGQQGNIWLSCLDSMLYVFLRPKQNFQKIDSLTRLDLSNCHKFLKSKL